MPRPRTNKLLEYLDARGLLANGTPAEIAAARREYRRQYERDHKRRYRSRHAEVRFTVDGGTVRELDAATKELGIDRSTYAREALLSRLQGKAPRSEERTQREVMQRVALLHSEVRHLCRQRPTGFLERRIALGQLERQVEALEKALRESLRKDK